MTEPSPHGHWAAVVAFAMVQFAWPAFTESRRDRHLVVVEVPRHVTEEPAPLLSLMLESLEPKGDFAMSSMKSAAATVLYCAFSSECDAIYWSRRSVDLSRTCIMVGPANTTVDWIK